MGSLSNAGATLIMNHLFNAAQSVGSTVYLALCTGTYTPATADGYTGASCSEVANANGYARKAISFGAASARRITQDAQVDFDTASGSWGTVTHWVIVTSATYGAGTVLAHGDFTASFSPVTGNTPRVASGQVYVEITAISGYGLTTWAANGVLGHFFDATAFTSTAGNTFLALLNAVCSDAATTMAGQTEVSGTNYARKEVNENGGASPTWTTVTNGVLSNQHDTTFATPGSGGWTQLVAVAIVDALSGTSANVIAYDNTNVVDQTPASGDTVQFLAGDFDISLA